MRVVLTQAACILLLMLVAGGMVYCQIEYVVRPSDTPALQVRMPVNLVLVAFVCYALVGTFGYGAVDAGVGLITRGAWPTYASGLTTGVTLELLTFGSLFETGSKA
jgi:hypothetical protein